VFEDSFANDANYKELNDKAKEANRLKNAAKQQILRSPAIQELSNKVKAMKEELADLQDSLSDYLREYQRTTGSNVFVGDNGEELEIVHVTKLVRRNSKYRP
jgi:seryl-tRNA synthetase